MAAIAGLPTGVTPTDENLRKLSEKNPGWKFERDDSGSLMVTPTPTPGGKRRAQAFAQLAAYAQQVGGEAFDSSTGFRTRRGGLLCPEAAWVSAERLAKQHDKRLWQAMPEIAIEVASYTDNWPVFKRKVDRYIENGAGYAIAIDPRSRRTYERGQCPGGFVLNIEAFTEF
jgi:Uma2 family endonuclease